MNLSNNLAQVSEEMGEGRPLAKGNADQTITVRTQSRATVSSGLGGVREAARRDKKMRVTALLHHVDLEMLRSCYDSMKKRASPGVDGMTWVAYGDNLEERLTDLLRRVHVGEYRALPSRRVYIPKADVRQDARRTPERATSGHLQGQIVRTAA